MGISGKKGGEPPPGEEFPIPEGLEARFNKLIDTLSGRFGGIKGI